MPSNETLATPSYARVTAASRLQPSAVTPRTRPPTVTTLPSRSPVAAWYTMMSDSPCTSSRPRTSSPVTTSSGYPRAATTTHTAGSLAHSILTAPRSPAATPVRMGTMSDFMRATITWVSGSPKRALNSRTFGPCSVIISPT